MSMKMKYLMWKVTRMIGCRMTNSAPQIILLNTILEMSAKKKMMCIQNPDLLR